MEDWRSILYPLGFIAGLIFGLRFIMQWLQSEKAKKSVVTRSFWQLSLLGNILLMVHSLIQMQIHICIVQACNGVISWRNLNLMQKKRLPLSFTAVLILLIAAAGLTVLAFVAQDTFFPAQGGWFRIPTAPWQQSLIHPVSFAWHAIGTLGYLLFSSRFYVQWWLAERAHASILPPIFWWLSLIGAVLSLLYFIRIGDSVNLIGPLLGLVPYIRNLMLMQKNRRGEVAK